MPGQKVFPWIGILICLYLLYSTSLFDKLVGGFIILAGIALYVFFSPKQDIHHLKDLFISEEAIFFRAMNRRERFLGNFMLMVYRGYQWVKKTLGGRSGQHPG